METTAGTIDESLPAVSSADIIDESPVQPVAAVARKQVFIDQITSKNSDEFAWIGVEVPDVGKFNASLSIEDENSYSGDAVEDAVTVQVSTAVHSSPQPVEVINEDVVVAVVKESKIDFDFLVNALNEQEAKKSAVSTVNEAATTLNIQQKTPIAETETPSVLHEAHAEEEVPLSTAHLPVSSADANVAEENKKSSADKQSDVDDEQAAKLALFSTNELSTLSINANFSGDSQTPQFPEVSAPPDDKEKPNDTTGTASSPVDGLSLQPSEGEPAQTLDSHAVADSVCSNLSAADDRQEGADASIIRTEAEQISKIQHEDAPTLPTAVDDSGNVVAASVIVDAPRSDSDVVGQTNFFAEETKEKSALDKVDDLKNPNVGNTGGEQVAIELKTMSVDLQAEQANEPLQLVAPQVEVVGTATAKADAEVSTPTENRKGKSSTANGNGGSGVFGFFQKKKSGSPSIEVEGSGIASDGGDNSSSDKRKKSSSLDKRVISGEDRILSPAQHGATLPSDSKANGFQIKYGFGGGKDKTSPATTDDDIESPDSVAAVVASSRKPRPHSADVKSGCKSPSKTNLRIFEIMGSQPATVGGAGPAPLGGANGPGLQNRTAVTSPSSTRSSAIEASVFCPVGPPSTSDSTAKNINQQSAPHSVAVDGLLSPSASDAQRSFLDAVPQQQQQSRVSALPVDSVSSSSSPSNGTNLPYIVAVAIDFGTTFSGYAFSFIHDISSTTSGSDRSTGGHSIHMMGKWEGGDPGVINQKTPTTLLLTPDGQFHSFGFTARNFYHDLSPEEADEWMYFDKFKMALYHSQECNTATLIEAANGKRFPALKAISMTLGFFKQHALAELSSQCGTKILNDDVRWVVTVPAIWNAQAKQFMRLAAYEAGLASPDNPNQLLIALEPEAASIHIRRLRMHQLVPEKPIKRPLSIRREDNQPPPVELERVSSKFSNRTIRYMVVDCGGGTVDITVHELDTVSGRLQELHKAAGGPHGSCGIDGEFEKLMESIFGAEHVRLFRRKRPAGWICLMTAFESRKRAADPFKTNALNIPLPFSFIDFFRKNSNSTVEAAINKYGDKDIRWSSQGMLRLTQESMKKLFQPTMNNIRHVIADVLNHPRLTDVQYIFMVGGLSESTVVQQDLRESFGSRVQVLVPHEASLAVLKGAVNFGLDQTVVTVRRSRLTYGAAVLKRFVRGRHPESKLLRRAGIDWCRDVFDPYVVVDQLVRHGEIVVRRYAPASPSQTYISITIFSSQHPMPVFTTDEGVSRCATLRLDLLPVTSLETNSRQPRVIEARMAFADTEVSVSAVDTATGQSVNASIDFFDA